jgi:hypothetical protein
MLIARDPGMDKDETPRNKEGQPPTRSSSETEDRLEEKEQEDHGQANKDRIEAKISELKD